MTETSERAPARQEARRSALRRRTRTAIIAVALAAAVAAPQALHAAEDPAEATASDISLFGSYLAAHQASNDRDRAEAARFLRDALTLDPGNRMLLERAMVYELSSGNFENALALAPGLVEEVANNLGGNVLLGLQAMKDGNFAAARVRFAANDSGPIARLASGLLEMWVFQAAGDEAAAQRSVDALEGGSSFDTFRVYHAAILDEMQGRDDDAEAAYATALESSADLRTVDAFGRFLERHGRQEKAMQMYRDFLADAPDHPVIVASMERLKSGQVTGPLVPDAFAGAAETLYMMGSALTQDGGGDLALIYLNLALFARPGFEMAQFLIADIHDRQNRHEEAIAAYSAITAGSPLKREAEIQAALNLDSLERPEEARERLDTLILRDPADSVALISAGNLMRSQENYAEAIPYYDRAIALITAPKQDDWRLYYFRGICHERTDSWPLAERDFRSALALDPEQPLVLNYLGYSWIDLGVNLDEALDMVKRAVEQRPDDGYIVDSLGWAYYRLGEFDAAVEELERAVELRPDDAVINEHLGDAYWRVGRLIEARFQWDHALAMDPEPGDLEKIRAKLQSGLVADEISRVVAETTPATPVEAMPDAAAEPDVAAEPEADAAAEPEADVAAVTSPERQAPATHVVVSGDTLWGLARRFLGRGVLYERLYEANRDRIGEGYRIYPGDELVIPAER